MKKLLGYAMSVLFLTLPLHSHAQDKAIRPGEYIAEGGWGTLTVTRNNRARLSFEISTIGDNAHTCNLSGDIRNDQAVLVEDNKDKPCIVTFESTEKGVNVSSNGEACRYYCGMRASFDFPYLKPQPECESSAIQKARNEFKQLYDKKGYSRARARLEPVLKNCSALIHWADMGWIRNDLAITQYKLGDYEGCLNTLRSLKGNAGKTDKELREEYSPSDADNAISIAKATRTNLGLCTSGKKKP